MITLNLVSLLLISIIFISIFPNKYVRTGLSVLFSVFFCLEVSSLYIGGSFIDYKYYLHFNSGVLSMSGGFIMEIFLFFLLLIALSFLFFFASNVRIFKKKRFDFISKAVIFIVCLAVLIGSRGGIYDKLKEIYSVVSTPVDKDFDDLLKKFGLTSKKDLKASSGGKNIIIISLESFEKAFLHDKNRELTPNLRKRKESWTFYEMKQNKGSEWTAGSLYTVFTGLPSYFTGHPNFYLEGAKESQLVSFGDILNRSGYKSYHLSNNATFAGTRDILNVFGINNILDGTFDGKYQEAPFGGAYDKDIFAEAKEILEKRTSQKPFMLFISTIQVHTPDGWVDDRMLQLVEKKETDLETVALSTDWLVEDFISFLENKNLLENTVVYLFPDHRFMGWKELFNTMEESRGLWFMTNAGKNDLRIDSTNFYQIDLLPNILSGAKITHNARFLSDFIEEDKNEFIEKNGKLLTALNTVALTREKMIVPFSMIVDGKQYAPGKRGLNIVVFDTEKQEVVDAFNVDTHGDEMLKINRNSE